MVLSDAEQRAVKGYFKLSDRELEVCLLLCSGVETNDKIAAAMNIGRGTVGTYLTRIYGKMPARSKLGVLLAIVDLVRA